MNLAWTSRPRREDFHSRFLSYPSDSEHIFAVEPEKFARSMRVKTLF